MSVQKINPSSSTRSSSASAPPSEKQLEQLGSSVAYGPVIKSMQATRALEKLAALSPGDRASFESLTARTESPVARAYLWKALAASHPVTEIEKFAAAISGFYDEELRETLTLRDAKQSGIGASYGLAMQLNHTCSVSVLEEMQGELDPIFALEMRTRNPDLHEAIGDDRFVTNKVLQKYEGDTLTKFGGNPSSREVDPAKDDGRGIDPFQAGLYNSISDMTGLTYEPEEIAEADVLSKDRRREVLDVAAEQLRKGIPTPLSLGNHTFTAGHGVTMVDVQGQGAAEKFLVHDANTATTRWISKQDFIDGKFNILPEYGLDSIWDIGKAKVE